MFDLSIKVLVVDDMLTMRKIVSKTCKELGFKDIVEAADGNLAFQGLQSNPSVGLIISDWNMPNCTGIDFLRKVRAEARFAKLPFIMLTAESEAGQVAEAIKAGVDNYIVKPFTADVLSKKLEETHLRVLKKAS